MLIGVSEFGGNISKYICENNGYEYVDVDNILNELLSTDCDCSIELLLANKILKNQLKLKLELRIMNLLNDMDNKNNIVLKYSMLSTLNIFEDLDISIDVINEINNVENLLEIYKKNYKDSQVKNYQLKIDMNKEWEKNINSYFNFNIRNNDLVTVVVPVYNTSNKLIKCVESLMKQSYRNIEILLINDGSTDNSLEVCKYLSNIDDRIKVISQDNKGLSEARNTGISNAKGEFICFVDSDDYVEYEMIEELLKGIKKYNSDFCECSFYIHQRDGSIKDVTVEQKGNVYLEGRINLINAYSDATILIPAWDKIYRLQAIKEIKFTNECFKEDSDFIYRLCLAGKTCSLIAKPYYHYIKQDGKSITANKISSELFTLKDWGMDKYNELIQLGKEYTTAAERILYNSLTHILRYYVRDYKNGVLKDGEYRDEIQGVVNNITNLLFTTDDVTKFRKLNEILDIIDYLLNEGVLKHDQFPILNVPSIGIVWNSMNYEQKLETIEKLKKKAIIMDAKFIDFRDEYRNFIQDIYYYNHEFEGIPIMKAGSLIDRYSSNEILILSLNIPVSGFVYYNKLKGYMYKEIAQIKSEIRKYFKPRIKDYAYDNIFHLTVNNDEYLYTKGICEKYFEEMDKGEKCGKCKKLSKQSLNNKNV